MLSNFGKDGNAARDHGNVQKLIARLVETEKIGSQIPQS